MDGHAHALEADLPVADRHALSAVLDSARTAAWALAFLTALALALRVTSLSRSLFNDETVSLALSQRSFGHMISLAGYEANGMPYPILLWPLTRIFGTGVTVVRLPAVLAGTASVPLLYWAARGLARGRGVALLAAALLAINPMAIWYSQVARSYAFVVLAACLAFGALARALERPERRAMWWLYAGSMALMAYSDLLAPALALPAQALMVWAASRSMERPRALVRRWAGMLAAVLVLCIPLIVAALIEHSRRDPLYWLPKLDRALLESAVQEFAGGFSGVTAVRWLTLLAGLVLVSGATIGLRRRSAGERHAVGIAAAWGLLPPAVLLVVSAGIPVFWPRYAIVALPGVCLLLALAAGQLLGRHAWSWVAAACVGLLLCLGAYADARQVDAVQQDWQPLTGWLRASRLPGQPVVVDNVLMLPSLGYYDPALRAPDGELVVTEWRDTPLPTGIYAFKDPNGYGGAPDGPPTTQLVQRLARAGGGTVWFVFGELSGTYLGPQFPAVQWAAAHCVLARRRSTGIEVLRASGCREG